MLPGSSSTKSSALTISKATSQTSKHPLETSPTLMILEQKSLPFNHPSGKKTSKNTMPSAMSSKSAKKIPLEASKDTLLMIAGIIYVLNPHLTTLIVMTQLAIA
jgi:hypothetical protein